MRGIHKKGKNGPGLTGIQRVLNTRERVQEVEDPCKVGDSASWDSNMYVCHGLGGQS